jgi:hypothetical protein
MHICALSLLQNQCMISQIHNNWNWIKHLRSCYRLAVLPFPLNNWLATVTYYDYSKAHLSQTTPCRIPIKRPLHVPVTLFHVSCPWLDSRSVGWAISGRFPLRWMRVRFLRRMNPWPSPYVHCTTVLAFCVGGAGARDYPRISMIYIRTVNRGHHNAARLRGPSKSQSV